MRSKMAMALGLALVSGSALAAADFSQLDQNKDQKLSSEELANSRAFDRWDTDGDKRLSQQELTDNQQAIDESLSRQQPAQSGGQAVGGGQAGGQSSAASQVQPGLTEDQYYDTVILSYDVNSDSWLDADEWPEDGVWE